MDNRAGEMEVFVAAAELGSFSAAGRRLKLSPSAVSKLVTRIEDRLGTRLVARSTRLVTLTPEGEVYLSRARRILGSLPTLTGIFGLIIANQAILQLAEDNSSPEEDPR